jgi:ubiquinone/menaquinone biosynthesis C-methylase UbiE
VIPRRVHEAAGGFDNAPDAYERGRPGYPDAAVRHIVASLKIGEHATVLDLAAGTGKLTRALVKTGGRLLALDPTEGMRRTFARLLPDVPVVGGQAEAIPFREGFFDAVVVAQAFHWFDAPAAIDQLHRVIRPGGGVALVWNVRDETFPFWAEVTEMLRPYETGVPRDRMKAWRTAFDGSDLFGPLDTRSFDQEQLVSRDGVFDRVMSISFIAALDERPRSEFHSRLASLLEDEPATAGREEISLPYRTDVYVAMRAGER